MDLARLCKLFEPVLVQAFIAKFAVEALGSSALPETCRDRLTKCLQLLVGRAAQQRPEDALATVVRASALSTLLR